LDEIRLDGGWVDLISSEAKPKISSALADFILAPARISFLQEFEFIRKNGKNIFFVAHRQKTTDSDRNLSFSTKSTLAGG